MADNKRFCVFLGGGGNAAVLIESLRTSGLDIVRAVLDQNPELWGQTVLGVPIVGGDEQLPELIRNGADCFVVGLGTTGTGAARQRLFKIGLASGLEPLAVIHPSAVVSPSARLGRGCQLMPGSIVNARAALGDNVLVNSGAIVEHDCIVGDHVHVATGARLAGGVTIDEGTLVGLGASVRQGLRIGRHAVIGAGAVVVKDVPDNVVVAGVPARLLEDGGRPRTA
jgi:UDP-perosamine 4-acetyltransferase